MNIKEASELLGVPKETLRYWENSGLIPEVPRNSSGYRNYTENEIKWALFVKAMRKAGMSVESLIDFINLYNSKKGSREAQKSLVKEQYETLLARRNELDKTLNYLSYKLEHFEDHVIPFLEEDDYYELRKKSLINKDNED